MTLQPGKAMDVPGGDQPAVPAVAEGPQRVRDAWQHTLRTLEDSIRVLNDLEAVAERMHETRVVSRVQADRHGAEERLDRLHRLFRVPRSRPAVAPVVPRNASSSAEAERISPDVGALVGTPEPPLLRGPKADADAIRLDLPRVPGQLPLTGRQWEIAALIAQGYTNRAIAERLVLEPGTVANHIAHILQRLGYTSRVQIAVWAAGRLPAPSD